MPQVPKKPTPNKPLPSTLTQLEINVEQTRHTELLTQLAHLKAQLASEKAKRALSIYQIEHEIDEIQFVLRTKYNTPQ